MFLKAGGPMQVLFSEIFGVGAAHLHWETTCLCLPLGMRQIMCKNLRHLICKVTVGVLITDVIIKRRSYILILKVLIKWRLVSAMLGAVLSMVHQVVTRPGPRAARTEHGLPRLAP